MSLTATNTQGWSLKLFVLICLFAWSSWIDINGVFVELSILVAYSPQGWSLPSYLTVVIQLANIAPLTYILVSKYCTYRNRPLINEQPAIFIIILVGAVASILLAFTWQITTKIFGTEFSTPLIVLAFVLACVDCMSAVTFLPFMSYFPQRYITAYYVGAGLSGLLPSIASLIQGVGGQSYTCKSVVVENVTAAMSGEFSSTNTYNVNNGNITKLVPVYFSNELHFSVQVFFFFITAMMMVSLIAFVALLRIKKANADSSSHIALESKPSEPVIIVADERPVTTTNDQPCITEETELRKNTVPKSDSKAHFLEDKADDSISPRSMWVLLVLNGIINGFSNGVLPAVSSYACLPYGNNIYHLALTLSAACNPCACFLYSFVPVKRMRSLLIGVVLYLMSTAYIIGVATTSPCPLLNNSPAGGIIMLIVSVVGVGLVSYLRTAISSILQQKGHRALLYCGISTQVGSLICALFIFPVISVYKLFENAVPCASCA